MSAPSGYTALDFVGFTDKGTYSPSATYMRNDLVHYGGNIMRCLIDNTTNVTPVVGANWELWVGASANLVERVIAPLENNPADVAYGVGRQIIYDDWLWEVIAPIAVGDALIDYAVDPTNANIKKSAPVETQLLAVKAEADATNNMIAPTETNASSSSAAYAVGDQLILNNILYDVIAAIQIGDALTTGTGGNIAAADNLTDQLAAKANSSDLATVATSGSYNDLSNKPTLGTAAVKNSTNAVTSGSTALVESGAVYSEVDSVKQALTNISINGNTNNTGSTITENTVFYLNGALAKAKQSIANGATLTLDTNYVLLPKGGFNEIGQIHAFSNELHLYRIGRLRILSAEGTSISFLTSITLPSVDRPYSNAKGVFDYFGRMGIIIISTDGTITVKQYMNYGESTPEDVSSTATPRFIVTWIAN